MALTLDPILAAAQDRQSHPDLLLEILTGKIGEDIPLTGQRLTADAVNETNPNVIYHSSGRLILVYISGSVLRYAYTDVARTSFNFTDIPLPAGHVLLEATPCEMDGGNVGILMRTQSETSQYLFSAIVTPDGRPA